MDHDLVKHGTYKLKCLRCGQIWSRRWPKPSSQCSDLPVCSEQNHRPYLSKTELDQAGYRTKTLPAPVACYYRGFGGLVMLYDLQTIPLRREAPRKRTRIYISELSWPLAWTWYFESDVTQKLPLDHSVWRTIERIEMTSRRINDIANMIAHLAFFQPAEIEQMAGPVLQMEFQMTLVRRHGYPRLDSNRDEQTELVTRAVERYVYAQRRRTV